MGVAQRTGTVDPPARCRDLTPQRRRRRPTDPRSEREGPAIPHTTSRASHTGRGGLGARTKYSQDHTAPSSAMQCNRFNATHRTRARAPPPRPTASEAEPRENSPPAAITPFDGLFSCTRAGAQSMRARAHREGGRFTDRAGASRSPDRAIALLSGKTRVGNERARERARARRSPTSEPSAPCGTFERSNLDIWMLYLGPLGLGFLGTLGNSAGLAAARNSRGRAPWPTSDAREVVPSFH